MLRSDRVALVLAVVVVLGGCNALPGEPTPTAPPSSVEPTATATEAPLPERPAPGLSDGGVVDALVLSRAHVTALSNASHTYVSVRVVAEDGRRLGVERTVRRVGDAGRIHLTIRVVGDLPEAFATPYDADVYANARMTLVRLHREDRRFSVVYPPDRGPGLTDASSIEGFLYTVFSDLNATGIERVDGDGRPRYRVRMEGERLRFAFANASDVTATALVDGSGMVWRLHLEYDAVRGGWSGRVERTIAYRDVGATDVDRPDWVEGALANATGRGG